MSTQQNSALEPIIDLARTYARARDELEKVVEEIDDRRRQVVRSRLRSLKTRTAEVSAAREALKAAVEGAQDLFESPKTQTVDGIKFGWRKKQGSIEVADEPAVIKLIRRKLPKRASGLIKRSEGIDKTALRKLSANDLAKLGLAVSDPVDEVTITVPKGDLDKLVDALLEHGTEAEAS